MGSSRILIIDDHQLIIDGLSAFIKSDNSLEFVGSGNDGDEALKLVEVLRPDIVLMDIEMPKISGIQASEEIKRNFPEVKIIIISMHHEKGLVKKLLERGIDGYLLKNSSHQEVLEAIAKVKNGKKYFSEDVTLTLLGSDENSDKIATNFAILDELTEREVEILKLIAEGKTNKEIGDQLNISHRTVDTHRTNLMKKLEVNNVAGLIRLAFKNGLIN